MPYGWSRYTLAEIVRHNIRYRDYLRKFGIEALIKQLTEEAPDIANHPEGLEHLRNWWTKIGCLAPYDIQCYNIHDKITVLGHDFNGLDDVQRHRTQCIRNNSPSFDRAVVKRIKTDPLIYICEIYENYPRFDSYDNCDDRTYRNYLFKKRPFTSDDMRERGQMFSESKFCMVHERIPEKYLPVLYYPGEGDYMILATSKM